jgi:hypothetical protein
MVNKCINSELDIVRFRWADNALFAQLISFNNPLFQHSTLNIPNLIGIINVFMEGISA